MLQTLISGIEAGCWYSLLALAIVVIMKGADVPNFAMAAMGLVATYIGRTVYLVAGSFWLGLLAAIVTGVALCAAVDVSLMRRLASYGHFPMLLMTIGLGLAIEAVIGLAWGARPRQFRPPWSAMHVQIGTIGLGAATIITVVVTAIISLLLVLFFKAPMGVQMRALAEDRGVARLLGVKVTRMSAVAWALGGGIASVAIMLHAQSTLISVGSASFIIVYGFTAAVIGGFESIGATVFGGVLLGIIQQFAGHYISTSAEAAVALLVVVTLLIVRPSGLTSNVGLRDV